MTHSAIMSSWSPLEASTNGFLDDHANKELSLREKKQLQWSKEKAEEWFPFGRPGAGAPLKPNRSRRNSSSSAPQSNGQSHHHANGVHSVDASQDQKSDISSLRLAPPHQIPNGHSLNQHQSTNYSPNINNVNIPYGYVPSMSTPHSYLPYYQAYPGAIPVPLQTNGYSQMPIQSYQSPPQNSYYTLPSSYSHPVFLQQTSQSFVAPPPNHISGNGQPNFINANNMPMHNGSNGQNGVLNDAVKNQLQVNGGPNGLVSNGQANNYSNFQNGVMSNSLPNDPQVPQDATGRGGTMTVKANTSAEPSGQGAKLANGANGSGELSYTEQWANQLPVWQQDQQGPTASPGHHQHQVPNSLPLAQPSYLVDSPSTAFQASASTGNMYDSPSYSQQLISTPLSGGYNGVTQIPSAPTAWVSPMPQNGYAMPAGHQNVLAQKTAIVSPLQSKAPSLYGNETIDLLSSSFSGALPNRLNGSFDESGIHKRRYVVTEPKDPQELEDRQLKVLETKIAIEEQIAEKRRQQVVDAEKDRRDLERLERERRLLELRESRESEHERNKWKELMEEEERREAAIKDALEKARLEAKITRKAKLLQHAWSGRRSDSEELDSPPYSQLSASMQGNGTNCAPLTVVSVNSGSSDSGHLAQPSANRSPPSVSMVGSSVETSRSRSLPPVQHYLTPTSGVIDDRPIKPLTVDPLKLWEQFASDPDNLVEENKETRIPRREAPVRQSLRKSRSTEASRVMASRRAGSLERKEQRQQQPVEATPKTSKNNTVNIPRKLHPQKESETLRRPTAAPPAPPQPAAPPADLTRLQSAATYVLKRSDIFGSTNNPPEISKNSKTSPAATLPSAAVEDKPPVPTRRDKERKKSKSKDTAQKIQAETDVSDGQKLLQRRSSADRIVISKKTEENIENDNPWGDQLGGLNPLYQPISTRSRKKSRQASNGSAPNTPVSPSMKQMKDVNASLSDLAISISSESSKEAEKSPKIVEETPKKASDTSIRSPFTRGKLYSSFSVKSKPMIENKERQDRQTDVLKQLSLLKEQLKKSQKDVEDTLRLKTPFLQNGKNM